MGQDSALPAEGVKAILGCTEQSPAGGGRGSLPLLSTAEAAPAGLCPDPHARLQPLMCTGQTHQLSAQQTADTSPGH